MPRGHNRGPCGQTRGPMHTPRPHDARFPEVARRWQASKRTPSAGADRQGRDTTGRPDGGTRSGNHTEGTARQTRGRRGYPRTTDALPGALVLSPYCLVWEQTEQRNAKPRRMGCVTATHRASQQELAASLLASAP